MKSPSRNSAFNENEIEGLIEILRIEVIPDQWSNIKILLNDEWKEFRELERTQNLKQQYEMEF